MTGRRKEDKWTKWVQVITVAFALVFVLAIGFGLIRMFNEIETITKGQQALILNLTQKHVQGTNTSDQPDKLSEECVNKITFIKYQNETSREIKDLKSELNRLKQRVRTMKSPI